MPVDDTLQRAGGRYAQLRLRRGADDPLTVIAHQDLLTARLIRFIGVKLLNEDTPPLRDEQIDVVVALLRSGATTRDQGMVRE